MRHPFAVLTLLVALGGVAAAQPKPEDLARAKAHFKQGKAYQDIAAYPKAIAEYQEAYRLSGLPELLFNVAQCQRLQGDLPEALANFRRYLELAPDGKGADEARASVAKLEAEIEEKAAAAAAQREAERKAEEERRAAGGKPTPKPAPTPEPAPPPRPGRGLRIGGLVAMGAGALALGGGIYFGLDASAKSDALSSATGSWTQAQIDDVAAGQAAERNMIISFAVAAVGLGAGAYLYHLGATRGAEAPTVTPVVGPAGAGLVLVGSF